MTFLLFANITLWILDTFMTHNWITQALQVSSKKAVFFYVLQNVFRSITKRTSFLDLYVSLEHTSYACVYWNAFCFWSKYLGYKTLYITVVITSKIHDNAVNIFILLSCILFLK